MSKIGITLLSASTGLILKSYLDMGKDVFRNRLYAGISDYSMIVSGSNYIYIGVSDYNSYWKLVGF